MDHTTKANYIQPHDPWTLEERKVHRTHYAKALRFFRTSMPSRDAVNKLLDIYQDTINDPEAPWV